MPISSTQFLISFRYTWRGITKYFGKFPERFAQVGYLRVLVFYSTWKIFSSEQNEISKSTFCLCFLVQLPPSVGACSTSGKVLLRKIRWPKGASLFFEGLLWGGGLLICCRKNILGVPENFAGDEFSTLPRCKASNHFELFEGASAGKVNIYDKELELLNEPNQFLFSSRDCKMQWKLLSFWKKTTFQSFNLFFLEVCRNKGGVALRYFPSKWRIKIWSNKQQIIFTKRPKLTKNISIQTLSKEFKPIALEVNQLENRHTKNINWAFLHVQLLNIPI